MTDRTPVLLWLLADAIRSLELAIFYAGPPKDPVFACANNGEHAARYTLNALRTTQSALRLCNQLQKTGGKFFDNVLNCPIVESYRSETNPTE
jgi:hypothetical protein